MNKRIFDEISGTMTLHRGKILEYILITLDYSVSR